MSETERSPRSATGWLEPAARVGHTAKGTVYATAGALALWRSFDGGASASGNREAIRAIASAPPGKALVAVLAAGLAAYVLWRLAQAILGDDGAGWGRRALHLSSAAIYAALTVFAVRLLFGGAASTVGTGSRLAEAMARPRGPWVIGAIGAGFVVLGLLRLARPRGHKLEERVRSLELSARTSRLATSVGRTAAIARGIALLLVGTSLVYAAAVRGAVPTLPWLTALFGACLLALAANEWTRARYSLPDP